ncbi:Glycerol-3-phosphate dehydrogenase [NAD(P)+] [Aquisphaera giovannonii]|uniref:Glycerol-3-phosphate dehydrogenase [NAD(P)+] n=1 Tax=Aquisphaera giovannonii TaxID=406548 RepID=A0A5B9W9D7_9BACT|nr:NAD(P)H-dependent glycerol-3-phosphate dehydrogenase [Aquisphaera giovannonii]QEH36695.1 Glycerol-3-phosphate dehydrogenase [NAD(P)+] [Aquisphaera giovannonii]
MKRVAILGAGGMGTALALLFRPAVPEVVLWSRSDEHASAMSESRVNARHLPGIAIPPGIHITSDLPEALPGADLVVAAVPTAYLRSVMQRACGHLAADVPFLSVVKGIENATFERPSQIIVEAAGERPVAVLSGPSHAEEIARGLPASVVVAGRSAALNQLVQETLSHEAFRVYTNPDAVGVELAGALKNILGLAAGICDGLGFGDNAKAAMITRGLVEIRRLGVAMGGQAATFHGLAGFGDLVTTCYSPFGRNRSVGERVGRGEPLEDILAGMVNVAEGVPTTRSVHALASKIGVEMPITAELHAVLFEGKAPREAVYDLMVRLPKGEWDS